MTDPQFAPGRAVELFAGVGGFRLGLEGLPSDPHRGERWQVVWSNQWEPSTSVQHASDNYVSNFGPDGHVCADIERVLDWAIDGDESALADDAKVPIPAHELLVGGAPCQDYSVARPLPQAAGIEGRKGVLWWQIHRWIDHYTPRYVVLENVDRMLSSPASQRGRDFAIMLSSMTRLGYTVQWRVVNAADYGFPQRRRRVFVVAERRPVEVDADVARRVLTSGGVLARALPVVTDGPVAVERIGLSDDPYEVTRTFGLGRSTTPWANGGIAVRGAAWTASLAPAYEPPMTLGDVLVTPSQVPGEFWLSPSQLERWRYLKGAKREHRTNRRTGHEYVYSEGAVEFPDPIDRPARTILTGEGGRSPSRFKIVVRQDDRLRRLTPVELERLQGFPDDWTAKQRDGRSMSDGRRAFCMGNALVVGVVDRIARALHASEVDRAVD